MSLSLCQLLSKAKALHDEISSVLEEFKSKCLSSMDEFSDASELHNHVLELNNMLSEEKTCYEVSTNLVKCYGSFAFYSKKL